MQIKSSNQIKLLMFVVGIILVGITLANFAFFASTPGYDFVLRYNEAKCVRYGVNPIDVCNDKTSYPPYASYLNRSMVKRQKDINDGYHTLVHAYAPWSYIYFMPFTAFSIATSWYLYMLLNFTFLCGVIIITYRHLYKYQGDINNAIIGCMLLFLIYPYMESSLHAGNYGIIVGATIAFMAYSLNKGKSILAGVMLAIAMIKPQIALIFVFPLLLFRQFKTVFVGGVICSGALLFASFLTETGPITLLHTISQLKDDSSLSTLFFPRPVSTLVTNCFGQDALFFTSLLIGALLVVLACSWLKKEKDWFVIFAPSAIISVAWTYSHFHDRFIYIIPVIAVSLPFGSNTTKQSNLVRVVVLVTVSSAFLMQLHASCPNTLLFSFTGPIFSGVQGQVLAAIWLLLSMLSIPSILVWTYIRKEAALKTPTLMDKEMF